MARPLGPVSSPRCCVRSAHAWRPRIADAASVSCFAGSVGARSLRYGPDLRGEPPLHQYMHGQVSFFQHLIILLRCIVIATPPCELPTRKSHGLDKGAAGAPRRIRYPVS